MSPADKELVVQEFSDIATPCTPGLTVHEQFEEQVRQEPRAIAVVYERESLTYAELNARANQLAHYLRENEVGPDRLVGVFVDRCLEMIVALLGVLKAGAAYVPLDPNYPKGRLNQMIADAAPAILVTVKRLEGRLAETEVKSIAIDGNSDEVQSRAVSNLDSSQMTSLNLAYAIYTSGSTGLPKGVMVDHGSVLSFWRDLDLIYQRSYPCKRIALNASISFDASVQQIVQLLSGRCIFVISSESRLDPSRLIDYIHENSVQAIDCTPSQMRSWISAGMLTRGDSPLRVVLVGGEPIDGELWRVLSECKEIGFFNVYGPTECTVDVSVADLSEGDGGPNIGRPMKGRRLYVLDSYCQPVPIGTSGEIYVSGRGVGRGYLRRPELTAVRFKPDPFLGSSKYRMYQTGDLGRWRADGTLEYVGRNDKQVKVRGHRIELGEIEEQLRKHELVEDSIVIVHEERVGDGRLVAYVTRRNTETPTSDQLKKHLRAIMPEYMVPLAYIVLDTVPLTPSGKLDRQSLPPPRFVESASERYETPRGEVEKTIATVWQDLLHVRGIGRLDNFFNLGGHSLHIGKMLEQLRTSGLAAQVKDVFESSTLADLAARLTRATVSRFEVPPSLIPPGCDAIEPEMLSLVDLDRKNIGRIVQSVVGGAENIQDIYPLTPLQEGILFHHLLEEHGSDTYVRKILLSLPSRDELRRLVDALQAVIDRHDILRTDFHWEQLPRPVQVVHRQAALSVREISLDWRFDPIGQLTERMKREQRRIDLRRAPLLRLQVCIDPQGDQCYAIVDTHHLISDNDSLERMMTEVEIHMAGRADTLCDPVAYRNHVAQTLARERTQDIESFFRRKLGDVDSPTAPFGLIDVHGDGSRLVVSRRVLDEELARRVRAEARRSGMTSAILFHAAWALVLALNTGQEDVVFGSVLLGRMGGEPGAQQSLGMFINTLPLRIRLHDVNARELIQHVRHELVELLSYEQASLAIVQRCSSIRGGGPLFTTLLNYRHISENTRLNRASGMVQIGSHGGTNYPMTLSVDEQDSTFGLEMRTDQDIDPDRVIGHICEAMRSLVTALEELSERPALALAILPREERNEVIELFNCTDVVYPNEKLIHELIEEQVVRTPNAIAVSHEAKSLTYLTLNARANQLARQLESMGAGPGSLVALCVPRGVDMLVGLLGILKAGAAYVPMDATNPAGRMDQILRDAAPRVVLTCDALRRSLPPTTAEVISLDGDWVKIAMWADDNLDPEVLRLSPRNLAYVIYTSGSTGRPKGVMVEHRNIVNYASHAVTQFDVSRGSGSLVCSSISFDLMLTGLYPTLLCGRTVWLCAEEHGLPQLEEGVLRSSNLAPLKLTPSHLALLEESLRAGKLIGRVRALVLGGEPLRFGLVQLFRKHAPGTRIFNHYGPTEATVGCVVNDIGDDASDPVSIGRPISNARIYILNSHLQPVPIGVSGEIYIGGAAVTAGYLNRPDLTAERFIANPTGTSGTQLGARIYKSGDRGRWKSDGTIEYVGRLDRQVKIRGHRIELGEIESLLARHVQVKRAVVVTQPDSLGSNRLIAYVTFRSVDRPGEDELRTYLRVALPEIMVPERFIALSQLPLKPNGKLDVSSLPTPDPLAYASENYEAPQGEIEETLSRIWRDLLRVERVGRSDNFFDLGGQSLIALRVVSYISHVLDLDLSVRAIFDKPTVQKLSEYILEEMAGEIALGET